MTLPYNRNFKVGRGSEQFLNDEFHEVYESIKNIPYRKEDHRGAVPTTKLDGALWFDRGDNELNYYDQPTKQWINIFAHKFQITDQILNIFTPSDPVPGQLWIYNGVLMYFDGSKWQPVKAMIQDDTQWSNAAFEDFMIITPLDYEGHEVIQDTNNTIDYQGWTKTIPDDDKWSADNYELPEIEDPEDPKAPDPNAKNQYLIPNLNTDRVFLENLYDDSYDEVSKVCFEYYKKDTFEKTVSAVHLNPGRLTKITKRLIKVDKLNPSIDVSAYNTEFYGFRAGEYGGDFLLESHDQDWGDYIPSGNKIILNYSAANNYDYVMAITYSFTWVKSDGSMEKHDENDPTTSFYISNLIEPINVHADGFKVEEAAVDIDLENKTITIEDDGENVDIQAWSPYKKQYGYIRETDLNNRGIIRLHQKVRIPIVFVGGVLIHPIYGGLEFKDDKIYVPNPSGLDMMKNMPWCVVDLMSADNEYQYREVGEISEVQASWVTGEKDYLDGQGNFIMHGELKDEVDEEGFRDFILASGRLVGVNAIGIRYDTSQIGPHDGIILFVGGLLVSEDSYIRDKEEGLITFVEDPPVGMEYLLLRDKDGRLYNDSNMVPAYSIGYLNDSLVYLNGKLLANENCVATTDTPAMTEADGVVHNEIKFFIKDELEPEIGDWQIYDTYDYVWNDLTEEEKADVELICSSYVNLLTSVKINVPYDLDKDRVVIYAFKYANTIPDIVKTGIATFDELDEEDGRPIYITGTDAFSYGYNTLNLYRNGVKMVRDLHYQELLEDNKFKLLIDINDTDTIQYIIEPIEKGETFGHQMVLLSNENAIQPNVYQVDDNGPDLYPGRVTVYINGLRLPNDDWTLLGNKEILLKYNDFKAIGSANNYPEETYILDSDSTHTVTHNYPDYIMIEIRNDYDRRENTIDFDPEDQNEIYLDKYEIPTEILDTVDEVLIFYNGQYTGLSRRKSADYRLDKYKGCISLLNSEFVSMLNSDPLKQLFDKNALIYAAWKKQTGNTEYEPDFRRKITLVWR